MCIIGILPSSNKMDCQNEIEQILHSKTVRALVEMSGGIELSNNPIKTGEVILFGRNISLDEKTRTKFNIMPHRLTANELATAVSFRELLRGVAEKIEEQARDLSPASVPSAASIKRAITEVPKHLYFLGLEPHEIERLFTLCCTQEFFLRLMQLVYYEAPSETSKSLFFIYKEEDKLQSEEPEKALE